MNEQEQQDLVKRTVHETLLQLGVDTSDPEHIVEFQRDLHHLRRWRTSVEAIQGKSLVTVAVTLVTGALAAMWLGIQHMLGAPPH